MHSAFRASHGGSSQVALVLCAMLTCATSFAFAQPGNQHPDQILPRQLVTFEIVLGRLQLSQESFRIGAAHERLVLVAGGERVRSISVSLLRGRPTLQYQDMGGDEDWKIQFKAEQRVELQFASRASSTFKTLNYHQPSEGPIAIEVTFGNGLPSQRVEANSLWHLLLNEPEFFYKYVEPVLLRMEPTWEFRHTREKVQQLLREQSSSPANSRDIQKVLAKLDSQSAAERSASCRELERLGLSVKIELQTALTQTITCQRRSAIDQLLRGLQPSGNDTAMRIAVWLGGDHELHQAKVENAGVLR